MIKAQLIGILTVIFIITSVFLNFFNLAYISGYEIFGYSFIILGSSLTYTALNQKNKIVAFIGTVTFLSGVLLIMLDKFDLHIQPEFILPIVLIIAGCGLLITYFTDFAKRIFLVLSLIFLTAGFTVLIFKKSFDFEIYYKSILPLVTVYWPIILIMIIVVIIINKTVK